MNLPHSVYWTSSQTIGSLLLFLIVRLRNVEDESSGEDDSDEDWGKNVKNVVGVDDNEREENECFEEEESVERKRKRKPVTT